jgi:pilus assembly protein CpaF
MAQKPSTIEDDEDTDPNIVIPQIRPPAKPAEQRTVAPAPVPAPAEPSRPAAKMPEMGILNDLMKDPTITEIMINDTRNIIIEKEGKLITSGLNYSSVEDLNRITRNILDITGRILSPDQPYVDTSLPDGSRVNIVGPPLTVYGPCITIRRFPSRRLTTKDLVSSGAMDQKIAYFLSICVMARLNILVSGGTGSGKTTLLNVLTAYIPKDERIVTIEDTPELVIQHVNSVRLQTKPSSPTLPAITIRDLVANSLRMRPDRIIIGEVRKGEAFDMLIAMNTGHSGSMTTVHANSPRDALMRIETLCMLAGTDIPALAIRKQITSALDLIVQIKRFKNGQRKVIAISEVTGMEGETITIQDIFLFDHEFKSAGFVPSFVERLREEGFELPPHLFD